MKDYIHVDNMRLRLKSIEEIKFEFDTYMNNGAIYFHNPDIRWVILDVMFAYFGKVYDIDRYHVNNETGRVTYRISEKIAWGFDSEWFEKAHEPIEFISDEELTI